MAGVCGFALLEKLNQINVTFLKEAPCGFEKWSQIRLFEDTYSTVRKSFKDAMAEAGVPEWAKVTHMRKAVTVFLTAQGLPPEIVKTITKHKVEVFFQSYVCELSIPVCVCLAGFLPNKPNDSYFVPRTTIGLPGNFSRDQLTNILFPNRETWISEVSSLQGDNSKGAKHFLFEVLPFLSEVIVQDGIYWVKQFPLNPASRQLIARLENKVGMQHYLDWAKEKRKEIEDILLKMGKKDPCSDETGVIHDCELLHQERLIFDEQRQQLMTREKALNDREMAVYQNEVWLRQQHELLVRSFRQSAPNTPHQQQQHDSLFILPPQSVLLQPNMATQQSAQHLHQNNAFPTPVGQDGTDNPHHQNVQLLCSNANDAMKPIILSVNSYLSLENLVNKRNLHLHNVLLSGKKMTMDDWADPKRDPNNWSRLRILYDRIKHHQDESGESAEEAAKWLDIHERQSQKLNLNKYLRVLKTNAEFGTRYIGTKRKRQ